MARRSRHDCQLARGLDRAAGVARRITRGIRRRGRGQIGAGSRRAALPLLARAASLPLLLLACGSPASGPGEGPGAPDAASAAGPRRAVILFIGDGMGPVHLEAARRHRHGADGPLFLQTLPARARVITSSLSGTTDSAAAATAMATGAASFNGAIGVDDRGEPVETLVERARALGLATGVVTTSTLSHATPGAFTAHRDSRADELAIAEDQALRVRPDVLLGGGAAYYLPAGEPGSLRTDDGLIAPLREAGHEVVDTAAALDAAPAAGGRLLGLFAAGHLTYEVDRPAGSTQPTLEQMTVRALEILDRDPDGFLLVVEGARIDMASHVGDLERAIGETLALDDAVAAAAGWAAGDPGVTILVTADHECGGLELLGEAGGATAGDLPAHRWRWGRHSGGEIDLAAAGPGAALLGGRTLRHTEVYEVVRALVDDAPPASPASRPLPDGRTADLRHRAATQQVTSGFGPGHNRLDALWLDADRTGLAVGLEGLFQDGANAVVLLIDVDPGAGTGLADLAGALEDRDGRADALLAALPLLGPDLPGHGIDLALVVRGAAEPMLEERWDDAGLRGLRPPYGARDDLGWHGAAVTVATAARGGPDAIEPVPGHGLEALIPWSDLYPGLGGRVPPGARIALAAVLVNDGGTYLSNQMLPPLPAGAANPGAEPVALPGLVEWQVDGDGDGAPDGDLAPVLRIPSR